MENQTEVGYATSLARHAGGIGAAGIGSGAVQRAGRDLAPSSSLLGDAISGARMAIERVRHCRFYLSETADRTFGPQPPSTNKIAHSGGKDDIMPPSVQLRMLLEELHAEIGVLEAEAQRFGTL
jgi:hypothetical protein